MGGTEKFLGSTSKMKEVNETIVRNSLRTLRYATKRKLASETGLSVVTINSILKSMVTENEVLEDTLIPSNGGRPSQLYRYNENFRHGLAIYVIQSDGLEKVRVVVVNQFMECAYKKEFIFENITLNDVDSIVQNAFKAYPTIGAIGFALPGEENDGVTRYTNMKSMDGMRFTEHFRNKYKVPVIYENDVNSAITGYCHDNPPEPDDCFTAAYIPMSSCPGAGIFINQKLYRGKGYFAGEVTLMPIGVDWYNLNFNNPDEYCRCIARLMAGMCSVLAPTRFILYVDFFKDGDIENVEKHLSSLLDGMFSTEIDVSKDYIRDIETGIKYETLKLMESPLELRKL